MKFSLSGIILGLLASIATAQTPLVTTLAGSGSSGSANGQGTSATFDDLYGIALDSSGNLYVADALNKLIRKITPSGLVSTFAGSGYSNSLDGQGVNADFSYPRGIASDGSGNFYIGDYNNNKIRKITSSGLVSTFAGSGSAGIYNDQGTSASFKLPHGVAVDFMNGNIYVADKGNHAIRKITSSGVVTTLAGSGSSGFANGQGVGATFAQPQGVAVDGYGNVYVADSDNNRIRKITSSGAVTTLAGSGSASFADGQGTSASFNYPMGIAISTSGNLYVADTYNHAIRKVTPDGVVTTVVGTGSSGFSDGRGTAAILNSPYAVTLDTLGNIYFVGSNRVRKITFPTDSADSTTSSSTTTTTTRGSTSTSTTSTSTTGAAASTATKVSSGQGLGFNKLLVGSAMILATLFF